MRQSQARKIRRKVVLVFFLAFILIGAALFVSAGSLDYWQAWVFMGVLFVPLVFVIFYFLIHDPHFLERRLRFREKEARERTIIPIALVLFVIGFLATGLDHRFGWSDVPSWLVIASDVVVFLSYMLVFLVFRENSYASRIVEVQKKQKVITTGPYAVVRHPMYAGVMAMYLCVPTALGSYVALAFFVPSVLAVFFRIFDEERLLLRDLKGYRQYTKKVRYRLIPGVW
jgi:protein-S-isoprenylcysteine O-methyltransferase Ste14